MRALGVCVLLTMLVGLAVAVDALGFYRNAPLAPRYSFTNQSLLNATIRINTCKGEPAGSNLGYPPQVTLKGSNYTKTFDCPSFLCRIEYPAPGNYSIEVRWLNRLVYTGLIYINVSDQVININAEIAYVKFIARTYDMKQIDNAQIFLDIDGYRAAIGSGNTVLLPFGDVGYEAYFSWIPEMTLKSSGRVKVGCNTAIIEVKFPVLSRLRLIFQLSDGKPALGLNASVEVLYNGVKLSSANLASSNVVELSYAPLGEYTVRSYLEGRKLSQQTLEVAEKNDTYLVSLPLVSTAQIIVRDARGEVVQDDALLARIKDPLGRSSSAPLTSGTVTLGVTPLGRYELRVFSEKLGREIAQTFFEIVGDRRAALPLEVTVSIARNTLRVVAEGSGTLPSGSKIAARSYGVLLLSWYLDAPIASLSADLGYLPLGAAVQVEFSYGSYTYSAELSAGGGTLLVKVPIYDVAVNVVDLDGQPVSGCSVKVTSPYLVYEAALSGWALKLEHVPLSDVVISVTCLGVEVAHEQVSATSLKSGNVTVTAQLRGLSIIVKNALGRPVAGARVVVSVKSLQGGTNITTYTNDDGVALFNRVPLPPSGNVSLRVEYRGFVYTGVLSRLDKSKEVVLDVLVDTPFFALSTPQTLLVVTSSVAVTVFALSITKRYVRIGALRKLFENPFEEEREGFLSKLRRLLKKEKEGEEESIFFE